MRVVREHGPRFRGDDAHATVARVTATTVSNYFRPGIAREVPFRIDYGLLWGKGGGGAERLWNRGPGR